MTYNYFRLPNGIRLIHRQSQTKVAHCALMVNTGSRDEEARENGIAHLIEHMIFKGTGKRKTYHVLSRLENVGGDLNAYTTKEETCIHASFLTDHLERCLELFADIAFNATYPANELEKEKDVIIDEINSYKDTPAEEIFDEFEGQVFDKHPIGRNILGTIGHVKNFSRADIFRFIYKNYSTNEMVISLVADVPFQALIRLANKYFGVVNLWQPVTRRFAFDEYQVSNRWLERQGYLSHCTLGNIAFSQIDTQKHAMILLNNILGGPGLNSRLNLNIREKYGFCYTIESHYSAYSDTGLFVVYLGTDPKSLDKTIQLVYKELKKLTDVTLGGLQLYRAKQQLIGQLAISFESGLSETLAIARSHLLFDEVDDMQELVRKIERISATDLLDAANQVFKPDQISQLIFASNNAKT
ncbi:MAG: insulinase family protein [Bacteroidetes bacterium]|nr:insulinase family protein [Bacteroidota bacterium]